MRKILERCPTCGGGVVVTRLGCQRCDTVVHGRFEPCRFCTLTRQHSEFVLAFLRNRGNLKEMERETGQSYWALRAQLNAIIQALGYEPSATRDQQPTADSRRMLLEQLERGEIAVDEAVSALERMRRPATDAPDVTTGSPKGALPDD